LAEDALAIVVEPRDHEAAVVRPVGRLDLETALTLQRRLGETLLEGRRLLVVDLADTTAVDSTGLGALVASWKAARGAGGDLRLARPNEAVRFLLERTSLDRVLLAYATVEGALAGG
jgi:anti-anti-sigma factor